LAGPVAVGIVAVPKDFDIRKAFPGVGDSKVLTEKKREEIYESAILYKERGEIDFCVEYGSAELIDTNGITKVVKECVYRGVQKLAPDRDGVHVLLDGLLHAPEEYSQQTIIRGDATEPVISLASIVAKVLRDRLMKKMAEEFPEYDFEKHKGYGTKAHAEAIKKFGLSPMHRRTYCRSLSF
jgi:ribonuclease HII